MTSRLRITMIILSMMCLPFASTVRALDIEITHWWTSGGEAAAVKEFAELFNAMGDDKWIDGAIPGSGSVARPVITSRILGGDPMGATQLNHGRDAEELVEAGYMLDLTELAEKEGWRDFVRPIKLLDSCTHKGRIYCAPVNIHSWQWMWINLGVFEKAGINVPHNWHEFVASAPALYKAGVIPLAIGNQSWQAVGLFDVLLVGLGGVDFWKELYINRNLDAAMGDTMRGILQAFADARSLSKGSVVAQWNEATNLVITGRAAAQIMGDWAQGEFSLAGQIAGKDYDCLPGLGISPTLDTGGDAFYFPKTDDPEVTRAQYKLASMMMSKVAQVRFNLAKGSLPIRGDVDMSTANDCMRKGLEILAYSDNVLPSGRQVITSDASGQFADLLAEFWHDESLTVEEVQLRYVEILQNDQ